MIIEGVYTKNSQINGEAIMLDLNTTNLFGFQKGVCKKDIDSLLEAIVKGITLPAVKITKKENNYYMAFLIDAKTGKPDGGHHRAFAHYLANKKLNCEIIPERYKAENTSINIREIILIN